MLDSGLNLEKILGELSMKTVIIGLVALLAVPLTYASHVEIRKYSNVITSSINCTKDLGSVVNTDNSPSFIVDFSMCQHLLSLSSGTEVIELDKLILERNIRMDDVGFLSFSNDRLKEVQIKSFRLQPLGK